MLIARTMARLKILILEIETKSMVFLLIKYTDLAVGVATVLVGLEDEGQAKVRDAGRHVRLKEDVLALEVTVRHCWLVPFYLITSNFIVKEHQPSINRKHYIK